MALIARLPPDDRATRATNEQNPANPSARGVEWRVLGLSIGLAMISFGYGGLTSFSALFADALGISPRNLFLTAMAVSILFGRLTIGRTLDRLGHRRVLLRCLVAPPIGLALLALAQGNTFVLAGIVRPAGLMHPAYSAHMMNHARLPRRSFGAMLAASDTASARVVGRWLDRERVVSGQYGVAAALASFRRRISSSRTEARIHEAR